MTESDHINLYGNDFEDRIHELERRVERLAHSFLFYSALTVGGLVILIFLK